MKDVRVIAYDQVYSLTYMYWDEKFISLPKQLVSFSFFSTSLEFISWALHELNWK